MMTGRNARSEIILDGGGEMLFRIARMGEGKRYLTLHIHYSKFTILRLGLPRDKSVPPP
jgi:hypothetical protein